MVSQKNQCLDARGPYPFVTRRVHQLSDGALKIWSSRHHRKNLPVPDAIVANSIRKCFRECWFLLRDLNWWIGLVFAIGSALFIFGSALVFLPQSVHLRLVTPEKVFFVGSLPFTAAAFLQFYQVVMTHPDPFADADRGWCERMGRRGSNLGWWSCLLQLIGTLLFNVCTFNAMNTSYGWVSQDVWIWVPNMMGSVLFFLSGYLAFVENCHSYWRWQPWNLSWWVVFVNLVGCVGFLVSALLAINTAADSVVRLAISNGFLLQGSIGFFIGSVLLMPEAATKLHGVSRQAEIVPENQRMGNV